MGRTAKFMAVGGESSTHIKRVEVVPHQGGLRSPVGKKLSQEDRGGDVVLRMRLGLFEGKKISSPNKQEERNLKEGTVPKRGGKEINPHSTWAKKS